MSDQGWDSMGEVVKKWKKKMKEWHDFQNQWRKIHPYDPSKERYHDYQRREGREFKRSKSEFKI